VELPVVVLTSSTNPSDVDSCDFALLRSTLTAGLQYWLKGE
jgi:hypothetical protein